VRFSHTVTRISVFFAGATVAIAVGAAAFGPRLMELVFGDAFQASAWDLALLGAGAGCYLAAATLSQALLAVNRGTPAAFIWAGAALLFAALYTLPFGGELDRIAVGVAAAMLLAASLLALLYARRSNPPSTLVRRRH
jgi:O-antigen/teichoic acid export membrane protein